MFLMLGESRDVTLERDHCPNDRLLLAVHGKSPIVTQGAPVGPRLAPFLDDTGHNSVPRAFYYLMPFGRYRLDPFPENDDDDERDFDFFIRYQIGDRARDAVVTLQAAFDSPISWGVFIRVGDTAIDAGCLDLLNRDLSTFGVYEQFARGTVYEQRFAEEIRRQ